MSEAKLEEVKKQGEDVYKNLNEYLVNLDETQKMNFCREVRESWGNAMQKIYQNVLNGFREKFEDPAWATNIERVRSLQQAIIIFKEFEKEIQKYIFFHKQKVAKLQEKPKFGESKKNISEKISNL